MRQSHNHACTAYAGCNRIATWRLQKRLTALDAFWYQEQYENSFIPVLDFVDGCFAPH